MPVRLPNRARFVLVKSNQLPWDAGRIAHLGNTENEGNCFMPELSEYKGYGHSSVAISFVSLAGDLQQIGVCATDLPRAIKD
jgi:hypothetical protein